jgi:histidine ammonia-lyase
LSLDETALQQVSHNFEFLKKFAAKKLIYGINTGFGPMAQYRISESDTQQLQYNLIRSHSSGAGKYMPPLLTKGLMIARLSSFMQAHSGVHPEVVILLRDLINKNVYPCVYEHGGVGASGDLVQLAHLALVLIGEGEVVYEGVECRKDKDVIDETPAAYKDIDAVMAAQRDLVEIAYTLKQVLCVKG